MTIPLLDGLNINGQPAFVRDITVSGVLVVGIGKPKIRLNRKGKFGRVALYVDIPPTGSAIIVQIKLNGTDLFTSGNRPQIAAAANEGQSTTFNVTTFSAGDLLWPVIDQIGSGTAGADLWIGVEYE